jgi:hypothetical protein
MTDKKPAKATPTSPQISAATFPALRQFLRGYLHQDWKEEYDSPADAAQQFCEDADPQERQQVASEWLAFCEQTKNLSLPAISGLLSDKLGAAWRARSLEDFEAISAIFRRFARKT